MDNFSHVAFPFTDPNWTVTSAALSELKAKCEMFKTQGLVKANRKHGDARLWIRNAVTSYNDSARTKCNFGVIESSSNGFIYPLLNQLPDIIDNATKLSELIGASSNSALPILKRGENGVLKLDRKLICSLLANAFLSTYPKQHDESQSLPFLNFWRLFNNEGVTCFPKNQRNREKLKCFLEYFRQMGNGDNIPNTVITFERHVNKQPVAWENSDEKLVEVKPIHGKIENAKGMMMIDFANAYVGGGILVESTAQEEILFCCSPELVVARLFTEPLEADEVLVITGTRQMCSYTGYGMSFKFRQLDIPPTNPLPVDEYGREMTQIVAMDALCFSPANSYMQYLKDCIDRELHKSYTAFCSGDKSTSIATGHWGCGAFGGDPQLKFLLQWMAASQAKRPLVYHVQAHTVPEFQRIKDILVEKKITVGKLYLMLMQFMTVAIQFSNSGQWTRAMSVFDYIT